MKSVLIYYFSGTGNTKIVTDLIKEEFLTNQWQVEVIKIEDVLNNRMTVNHEQYDMIGIGCQVIGYGIPNIVKRFIRVLPKVNGKKVFVFRTAGGVAPINYNASKPMIRTLSRKGYLVFHERVFSIGSNWVVRFDDAVVKKLYEATKKKVSIMCREIINGERRILKTGIRLRILMEILMPISSAILHLTGKDLVVNKDCSHCAICIKNCPASNIYERRDKIKFGLSCSSCMRCVYTCPHKAISFRFLTFFPVPGGYNIKEVLDSHEEEKQLDLVTTPPFFEEYIKNDEL